MARKTEFWPGFARRSFAATASWAYLLVISVIALPASVAIGNAYFAAQHRDKATAVQIGRMQRAEAVGRTAGELSAASWTYSPRARIEEARQAFEAALAGLWEEEGGVPPVEADVQRRQLTLAATEYLQALERLREVQEAGPQRIVAQAFLEDVMPRRGRFADALETYVVAQTNLIDRVRQDAGRAFVLALLVSAGGFLLAVGITVPLARRSVRELQDLYEREQRATENAQTALAHRDELLDVIAHDLRNPIQHILLKSGVMLNATDVKVLHAHARSIGDVTRQTAHMLTSLLNAASIEHGQMVVRPRPASVDELLRRVVALFEMQAAAKRLELDLHIDEPGLHVLADTERLVQAIANLIANAIKFTPEGGSITVAARPHHETIEIAVTDTGPGIAPEHAGRLFERYYTAEGREGGRGLGLGLYIAKTLVEAHDGRIWVESTPGKGASFRLALPKSETGPVERPRAPFELPVNDEARDHGAQDAAVKKAAGMR